MSSRRTPRGGCENGCRNQWRAQTHQRWHAARGARRVRARPARRRCRTQSENRAPARLERRDGFCGRRHRSRAFCGRRMTTAVETIRDEPLTIGGRTFQSRLMVGTGEYPDIDTMVRAIQTSGAQGVTGAGRRRNLDRLKDAGCAAVMPLASPIGSGLGLLNPFSVRTIKRRLHVPVIVDAGVGTASDACVTMEQGVDGILMNTAIAAAQDPVAMAHAMRLATIAGRAAFLAGRMQRREVAMPSSPTKGMLD